MITDLHASLTAWLEQYLPGDFTLAAIPGDASFRRYYRVHTTSQKNYIAVDAPPATENSTGFVQVADALKKLNIRVPEVFQADLTRGFLLISDLGDQVFFKTVTACREKSNMLYEKALIELDKMQSCHLNLPAFDAEFMQKELNLFRFWLVDKHLQLNLSQAESDMLDNTFELLINAAETQPQCFVHRDYHSRNLMVLPEDNIGVLDFQDAVRGPITYDAVSLLRDCYVAWPPTQVYSWLKFFHENYIKPKVSSFEEFQRYFDLMGIQRHLKASFIFARKYHRDGTASYLKDLPRTIGYIQQVASHYPALSDFHDWISHVVMPRILSSFSAHYRSSYEHAPA